MPPKFRTLGQPRFSDFDLQGILNSRQYLDLLAEARVEQMSRCYRWPIEKYTERGLTFVIRRFEIDYGRPIAYGERFEIETWVEEVKGPMALVRFRFVSEGEREHASGSASYFLVDLKTKRPVSLTDEDRKIYLGT